MAKSRQYQFRASPTLEAGIRSVWNNSLNVSDNLIRIINSGVKVLSNTKVVKGGTSVKED